MRCYKQLDENGEVIALFVYYFEPVLNDPYMVEITEEEYARIKAEITAEPDPEPTYEISDSEALSIILGGDGA